MNPKNLIPVLIIAIFSSALVIILPIQMIYSIFFGVMILIVGFIKPKISLYILVFSMLLSPEILLNQAKGTNRGVTIRVDDLLILLIGLTWFAKIAIYKDIGLFRKTPLNRPISIYCAVVLLATLLGILMDRVRFPMGLLFVLKYIEYFIIYFMAANLIQTEKDVKNFYVAMLITCFLTCVIALYQIPADGRVTAPFEGEEGEPNTLGGYLMLLSCLIGGILLNMRLTMANVLLLPVLGLAAMTMVQTLSRSSWVASVPAGLVLFLFSRKKAAYFFTVLIILVSAPFILPQKAVDRLLKTFKADSLSRKVGGVTLDGSTSERIRDNLAAIEDWTKHPILGFGVTGYRFLDAQFPRVLVETGLLGILSFIFLLLSIWHIIRFVIKTTKDPFHKAIAIGVISGFVGLITHAISANTFIIVRIMEPFWFLMAIIISIIRLEQTKEKQSIS